VKTLESIDNSYFFHFLVPFTSLYFAYVAGRSIDIVQGEAFKPANRALNGLLKNQMREGLSKPTQHKPIISDGDLASISAYIR